MKILVVEDDSVARLVLESTLKSLGHEVVAASDGEAAWEELEYEQIRVVVSDWRMPRMDGLQLCERVRKRPGEYVYFILLTMVSATIENHDAALNAGVDDFLAKPVELRELRMRLHVAERILHFTERVKKLEAIVPICSYCKKIRDDKNYWQQIEGYLQEQTGTLLSHGVCPGCFDTQVRPMLKAAGIDDSKLSSGET